MAQNLHSESDNLKLVRKYPISSLRDIRKTFWSFLLASFTVSLAILVNVANPSQFPISAQAYQALAQALTLVAIALAGAWIIQYLYQGVVRRAFYYGIEEGHLVMSRGIILKQRGLFPLSRVTDVYLERSALDFLFGLHTLHMSTPTSLSERFVRIEGLDARTAMALQARLAGFLTHGRDDSEYQDQEPTRPKRSNVAHLNRNSLNTQTSA